MSRRPASAVDQYVGSRKVQKYEKGLNRVSVGRLYQICKVLKVPLSFMLKGRRPDRSTPRKQKKAPTADFINDFPATCEGIELVKSIQAHLGCRTRRQIVKLVTAMSEKS